MSKPEMISTLTFIFSCLILLKRTNADILVLEYDGRFIEYEMRDLPASFGNSIPYEGFRGMIMYANPMHGCGPYGNKAPNTTDNRTGRWILMAARGNCSFEQKIRVAQMANYDAMIIHNVDSDALENMSAKNSSGIHIPSVFIGYTDGLTSRESFANNSDFFVIINRDIPWNVPGFLIPFAVVVGTCFIIMICFMIAKFVRDRRRRGRERMNSSALDKIPIHQFKKGDPYETCAICLEDYVAGEKIRVLPCAHAYHPKCIDPWLTRNKRVCPVCKRRVFAAHETYYSDSDSESSDDTTPLLTASNRGTQGGTLGTTLDFLVQIMRMEAGSSVDSSDINDVTVSDQHSINGRAPDTEDSTNSANSVFQSIETTGHTNPFDVSV